MDREATATIVCAVLITAFFWLSIYLFKDYKTTLLGMPLWFSISCIGGYILSVLSVIILVKKFMFNFNLDEDKENES